MLQRWGRIIRDRWCKCVVRCVPVLLLTSSVWAAGDLASLVRAYRQGPTPARKSAVQSYAVTHPKEAALAHFALGVAAFEQKDYAGAVEALKRANLPEIADYTAYYLAAARVESKDLDGIASDLAATHSTEVRSPFASKAWVLEARAAGAGAVQLLRDHYAELPQPDGDVALAEAYQVSGDLPHAVEFYQRVFYQYVSGDAVGRAAAALL